MKKSLLLFAFCFFSFVAAVAQPTLMVEAPQNNLSTTQLRAPNGLSSSAYMRACALVLQTELSLIPTSSTITVFGFTLSNATTVSAPVTGNFTVYLENTTDVSYTKGTTWSTIISPMTVSYANVMTIPMSASSTSVVVTLATPFVYTGGGIYVAYDWYSAGPYSTANPATYYSENAALTVGCASGVSSTSAPTTLGTTNFRPSFLLGIANPYTNDVRVLGIESPGRIASTLNTPHTIRAMIKNSSSGPLSGINVSCTVTGPNAFSNVQVVPSLAAGQSTLVTFAAYNPLLPAVQTVSVTVPSDQVNGNNLMTYGQEVQCTTWGQNPASGSYTYNSVGFAAASGIIATPFLNPVTSTLTGLRGAVSTNTPAVGNFIYGVLLSGTGGIIATTNTITITTPMLGTFQTFSLATPVPLTPSTTYYIGFAQTVPGNAVAYYPAGTQATSYIQNPLYYTTGLAGGALTPIAQNFGYFGLEAIFAPTVTISAPAVSVTCGSNATLNAISSSNYSWSTNATTSSITVNNAMVNSNYTVTATNTLGCMASTIASLIVTPLPVTAVSNPTQVCAGDQVTLTASGATSYTWQTSAGTTQTNSILDLPNSNTTYTITGANPGGCSVTTIYSLNVNPLPLVNLSISGASVCAGNTIYLGASGTAVSYSWSTGQINTTTLLVTPPATTVYAVTGLSSVGCAKTTTALITVDSFTPGVTSPTAICNGVSVVLTATGASTLQWSNGSVFSSITVTPNITTTYTLIAKGLNNCIGTNSTMVTVNQNPTVTATINKANICKGESAIITATGAPNYSWSIGASTGPTIAVSPTTTIVHNFSVTGTDAAGCTATAQVSLKVNSCNSITENGSIGKWSAFPNPTTGKIYIKGESEIENVQIEVFNSIGQCVVLLPAAGKETVIDLVTQPAGCYFVKLSGPDYGSETIRIIKE